MSLGWLERALDLSEGDAILAARGIDWATGDRTALGLPEPASLDPVLARRAAVLGPDVAERWGREEADEDLRRLWVITCQLLVLAGKGREVFPAPDLMVVEREPLVLLARDLLGSAPAVPRRR